MDGKLPLKANLELEGRGSLRVATIVNGPIQTNTYIVVSQDRAVMIDPAWEGEKLAEHALALPGRCAPQTAGALIAQTVLAILEERDPDERSTAP